MNCYLEIIPAYIFFIYKHEILVIYIKIIICITKLKNKLLQVRNLKIRFNLR